MTNPKKYLRNFMYMNVPILHSMYSQLFEGVSDQITNERIIEAITSSADSMPFVSKTESQESEKYRVTENVVLHDHMYNKLEERLKKDFVDINTVPNDDQYKILTNGPIVKVTGRIEIEDYAQLLEHIKKFNQIGQAIAYAAKNQNPEHQDKVKDIMVRIALAEPSQRKRLQNDLDKLTSSIKEAKEMGLLLDQAFLERISLLGEMFNPNGYEVFLKPLKGSIHYRGILDRDWLRISPPLMSSMYGGQSELTWVMTGITTYIPGHYVPEEQLQIMPDQDNPMMLDAYRNMFRNIRSFERMFLESNNNYEVIVLPIAIYREIPIGD